MHPAIPREHCRWGNFQLDAPHYGPFRFPWICLPLLVSSSFSGGGCIYFHLKKFPPTIEVHDSFHPILTHVQLSGPGEEDHNILRTCFLSSSRGTSASKQSVRCCVPSSRGQSQREFLLLTKAGPSNP